MVESKLKRESKLVSAWAGPTIYSSGLTTKVLPEEIEHSGSGPGTEAPETDSVWFLRIRHQLRLMVLNNLKKRFRGWIQPWSKQTEQTNQKQWLSNKDKANSTNKQNWTKTQWTKLVFRKRTGLWTESRKKWTKLVNW